LQYKEAEELWKLLLTRDFDIRHDFRKTLGIGSFPPSTPLTGALTSGAYTSRITSIFGITPPARGDENNNASSSTSSSMIIVASSAFESYKHWLKASRRFYSKNPGTKTKTTSSSSASQQSKKNKSQLLQLLNGPYFLRAATFWSKIYKWCDLDLNYSVVGPRVRRALATRGLTYQDWPIQQREERGLQACQAIFAFCGGASQSETTLRAADGPFTGLLGGYTAYNYYSSTHLVTPQELWSGNAFVIATCYISGQQGVRKLFSVNVNTGMVDFLHGSSNERIPVVQIGDASSPQQQQLVTWDAALLWLEEYANRLTTGRITAGPMDASNKTQAIVLYPQIPPGISTTTTATTEAGGGVVGIPEASCAVTRGVQVVASAIYAPQMGPTIGFIYSIRIRLLTPLEDGYLSPSERGFDTCQLQSRHWLITDNETGRGEQIDGDGVVGMYPLLREGGYTEDGDCQGTFMYQSCTGRSLQGSFQGHLQFVPGSLRSPTGPAFNVELRPFVLNSRPSFLY
jgi:uncharacterized protein affecting Mg2+/Co2+ transport